MLRVIFVLLFCSLTSIGYAENWGIKCGELALQARNTDENSHPALQVIVAQSGKLYIYDSPNKHCRVKGHPVAKGVVLTLTVNFSIEAWVNATYGTDEEGWSGWVLRSNMNEIIDMQNPDITSKLDAAQKRVAP